MGFKGVYNSIKMRFSAVSICFVPAFVLMFFCSNPSTSSADIDNLPDSLFRYSNKKVIHEREIDVDYDVQKKVFNLPLLTQEQRKVLTDDIIGQRMYAAYFWAKQSKVGVNHPILLYVFSDDYSTILLLTLSKDRQVIDHMELTANICDATEEVGLGTQATCHERYSNFLNDSIFITTDLIKETHHYGEKNQITQTDSIVFTHKILKTGRLLEMSKDSTRVIR